MIGGMLARLARSAAVVGVAATLAAALAIACNRQGGGTTLPPAGTPKDDGSGLLAKASVKFMTSSDEGGFEPDQQGARSIEGEYGYGYGSGFGYGGADWYGAYGYGGSPYASFQPYIQYNPVNRTPDYAIAYSNDGGAIEGRLTWPKAPKVPETLVAPAGCGAAKVANPSLRLGAGHAVEGAVIYLEKITSGRSLAPVYGGIKPITTGGTVELRGCALIPRVQIYVPVPGQVSLSNGGDVPMQFAIEKVGDGASRIERRLEGGGARPIALAGAGVYRVGDAAGALAPAWIVAGTHPYYAMTDDRGRFRLDDVQPGDYTLVVWHPPVITGVKDGVVLQGNPVVITKKVVVKKVSSTKLDLQLP